jgi:hypothetical protein
MKTNEQRHLTAMQWLLVENRSRMKKEKQEILQWEIGASSH